MPKEFEKYLEDPNYTIINVPPTVMFKAKVQFSITLCRYSKPLCRSSILHGYVPSSKEPMSE